MVFLSDKTKVTLDDLLTRAVAENRVPGASFAVTTANKELYTGHAGIKAFLDPSLGKVDDNSVFWLCSMTKVVVTIALLQLVEKGKVSYETPAEQIIPELANPVVVDDLSAAKYTYKPAQNKILVKHLLNHTSGLSYNMPPRTTPDCTGLAYNAIKYEGHHSISNFFKILRGDFPSVPLVFEPGTSWAYGWSCDMAAFIVERLTGRTIHDYCEEHIFEPLNIKPSFFLTPSMKENLVRMSYRRKDGTLEQWDDQLPLIEKDPAKMNDLILGGIGLYSTMREYLTFLRHILLARVGQAPNPILEEDTVRAMFEHTVPREEAINIQLFSGWIDIQFGYGLCLATNDWTGRRKKGSGFWYGWAGTYYFIDPETGIAAAYGTQVVPTRDPEVVRLLTQLEEALYAGLESEAVEI